jgi:flagellar basal body-associated protein FliL
MADQNQMFSYYPKKKERPESPSETPVKLIIIIVLSVVVCILVGIILVYLLKCRKEKKKRANELNDDYEYNAVNTPSESATG